ncbi:hypothetical protein [Marinobacter sp. OP 3.4]|uniref:hypothetical protein n=1 Tax=Marinobacter sp. OP 3.4 TaxID=3076501 RepID=UPI002E233260
MAGQQGLGLAQGFMQGYSFMQGMDERKQRMGLRDQQAQRATETHQRQGERHDLTMDQARLQREQQQAQQVLGKMAHGLPLAEEEEGFLRDNPKYWPVLDPQTDKSLETAKGVMDPNSPVGMRSPETLDAINQMFGHRINRGEGGRKRIDGIYPGKAPGTVAFSVEVEGEDGRKYRAPMTVNRGTAGDDEVMQTPVDQLLGQVKGYDMLRQPFRNSPEAQARASKMLAVLTGKTPERSSAYRQTQELTALGLDPEQARNQAYGIKPDGGEADWRRLNNSDLYNQRTGDVRAGVGSRGGDGKAPADVQTAEWMVANGIAGDLSEAYTLVATSKSNPSSFISRYVSAAARNQDEYDPNKKSMQELTEEARQVYDQIVAPQAGLRIQQPQAGQQQSPPVQPQAQGLQMLDSSVQQLPSDGSAVPAPDGSMQGRVNRGGQADQQGAIPVEAQQQAAQIKAEYQAGNITREQAVSELRRLGFE